MGARAVIAISSCLLGHRVRYDGELKQVPELCDWLQQHAQLLPVCPEVEIGLSVPRPPLILAAGPGRPRMIGRDDADLDVSRDMYRFCDEKPAQLQHIAGYVFKARSPSCGLRRLPLFDGDRVINGDHPGLFAAAMAEFFPSLPMAEEEDLLDDAQRAAFMQRVMNYYQNTHIK